VLYSVSLATSPHIELVSYSHAVPHRAIVLYSVSLATSPHIELVSYSMRLANAAHIVMYSLVSYGNCLLLPLGSFLMRG